MTAVGVELAVWCWCWWWWVGVQYVVAVPRTRQATMRVLKRTLSGNTSNNNNNNNINQ